MKRTFLAVLGVALVASSAWAAEESPNAARRAACKADVQNLCAGVQRGGGRIAAGLKQNEAQVSPECKNAIAYARQQKKAPQGPASPQG
jgi:hypothetical protein